MRAGRVLAVRSAAVRGLPGSGALVPDLPAGRPYRPPAGDGVLVPGRAQGGTVMPSPNVRPPGTRLARCTRWLGLERNPLRRRTDRIEAAIRLAMIVLFLVAVPTAVIAAGRQADHLALRQAHARQAAEHQVTAVLLRRRRRPGSRIRIPRSR